MGMGELPEDVYTGWDGWDEKIGWGGAGVGGGWGEYTGWGGGR